MQIKQGFPLCPLTSSQPMTFIPPRHVRLNSFSSDRRFRVLKSKTSLNYTHDLSIKIWLGLRKKEREKRKGGNTLE